MRIIAVIPARYNSTRLPGKPLISIEGKPMIQWVWEQAKKTKIFNKIIIATDDIRILNKCKEFKAECVLTSPRHKSGTDRIAEVIKREKCEIVVNIQGDEPLISPFTIKKVIEFLTRNKKIPMATAVTSIKYISELKNPNIVKVVMDRYHCALYFSRLPIPYIRDVGEITDSDVLNKYPYYRHIGIYGYRRNFLLKFVNLKKGKLEDIEKLEQLRVLENGFKMGVVIIKEDISHPVDTKEDVRKVVEIIKRHKLGSSYKS